MKWFFHISFAFFSISNWAGAQECSDFYQSECIAPTSKFSYAVNPASRSFKLFPGEQERISFVFEAGKDYRILLCAAPVFNQVIQFDILNEQNNLLYSNIDNDFSLQVEFSSQKPQDVSFVITTPELESISDTSGCVGILIEEMKSVITGF